MRRRFAALNPTVRGLAIVALIALVVVVFQLYQTLIVVGALLRITFFLVIAFVLYLLWRDRVRHETATWPARAQWAFYGGAGVAVLTLAAYFWPGPGGPSFGGYEAIVFLAVLGICGFAMWRVWRDQRTFS